MTSGIFAFISLFFCSGLVFARFFRIDLCLFFGLGILAVCGCALGFKRRNIFYASIFVLSFILAALSLKNSYTIPKNDISRLGVFKEDELPTLKGFVNSDPCFDSGRLSFILHVTRLKLKGEVYKTSSDILVRVKDGTKLNYGDELALAGKVNRPYRFIRNKISGVVYLRNNQGLVRLPGNRGIFIKRLALSIKHKMSAVFIKHLPPLASSVVSAMVLGERKGILPGVNDLMVKSGTVHILVVSGFNVGVIAFTCALFLKDWRSTRARSPDSSRD